MQKIIALTRNDLISKEISIENVAMVSFGEKLMKLEPSSDLIVFVEGNICKVMKNRRGKTGVRTMPEFVEVLKER